MNTPETKSAFPVCSNGGLHEHQVFDAGMTLRDWFAGQAMIGLLANPNYGAPDPSKDAVTAFSEADAMMKARQ